MDTPSNKKELENLTVLIADDERDYVDVVVSFFSDHGAKVISCHCGEDAFAILQRQPVDALLTDLRMPNGTGIELLRKIRRNRDTLPKIPAIIVNTGFIEGGEDYLRALGADAVFQKPVSLPLLVTTIRELVGCY